MYHRHALSLGVSFSLVCLVATASPAREEVTPRRLVGHKGDAIAVAFRSDGKVLASGGKDGKKIDGWEAHKKNAVTRLAFAPDGKSLASTSREQKIVVLWDVAAKTRRATLPAKSLYYGFDFSPDGKTLAVTVIDSITLFVDVETGKTIAESTLSGGCVAYSSDGKTLAYGSGSKFGTRLVEKEKERLVKSFKGGVDAVALHPGGKILATGAGTGVKLWDVETGTVISSLADSGYAYTLAFSRDGKMLATSYGSGLSYWDVDEGKRRHRIVTEGIKQIAFHPDGHIVAAAGERAVWLYPVPGKEPGLVERPKSEIADKRGMFCADLIVSPSGKVVCWHDHETMYWRGLDDMLVMQKMPVPLVWSAIRGGLTSASANGYAAVFDKDEQKLIVAAVTESDRRVLGDRMLPTRAGGAFSPDQKTFAVGGCDVQFTRIDLKAKTLNPPRPLEPRGGLKELPLESVRLWDIATGKEGERLEGHVKPVHCIAYSQGGKLIASLATDGEVRVWDLATNKTTWKFRVELTLITPRGVGPPLTRPAGNCELAFAADDRILAVSRPESVTLFDVVAGKELAVLEGHTADITRIAVSPDGKLLASSAHDGAIILWDIAKGERLVKFRARHESVSALAFTPDGKTLIAGGMSTIWSWDVAGALAVR